QPRFPYLPVRVGVRVALTWNKLREGYAEHQIGRSTPIFRAKHVGGTRIGSHASNPDEGTSKEGAGMRRAIALVVLSSLLPLAGCASSNSVTGRALKVTPSELFDPCTLPDDALRSVSVDPLTERPGFAGAQSEGWAVCAWEGEWYFLSIFTTDISVEELRARPKNTDFRSVTVGKREAVTFRSVYEIQNDLCDLAYPTSQGTVIIRVNTKANLAPQEDPCAISLRTAIDLDPRIPE
ncbi:DUF3558 domain-containing protein, partial [Rhodococcus sp. NPDC003382]